MTSLQEGIKKIEEAFSGDFVEKYKSFITLAMDTLENRYCICGDNRNLHENGEGGSPSSCEEEDCLCNDYHFSLIHSLIADRNEFAKYREVKEYPLLPLLVVMQASGFDSDYLQLMSDTFLWNGDPATKPKKNEH